MLGPLYALFTEKFQATPFEMSLTWAAYLSAATVGAILVGAIGDSVKEQELLLVVGYFIRAGCWLAFMMVPSIAWLLVVQVGIGIGDALGAPSFDALMATHTKPRRRIADYSNWKLVMSLVMAAGTLLGGYIVTTFNFSTLFCFMSALAVIAGIGILVQPRDLL